MRLLCTMQCYKITLTIPTTTIEFVCWVVVLAVSKQLCRNFTLRGPAGNAAPRRFAVFETIHLIPTIRWNLTVLHSNTTTHISALLLHQQLCLSRQIQQFNWCLRSCRSVGWVLKVRKFDGPNNRETIQWSTETSSPHLGCTTLQAVTPPVQFQGFHSSQPTHTSLLQRYNDIYISDMSSWYSNIRAVTNLGGLRIQSEDTES